MLWLAEPQGAAVGRRLALRAARLKQRAIPNVGFV